jgi:DNA-binding protein
LNKYVGYCKAQFEEEFREYIVIKARGGAIETALKIMQLVKDNIGSLHSYTNFNLQLTPSDSINYLSRKSEDSWARGVKLPLKG